MPTAHLPMVLMAAERVGGGVSPSQPTLLVCLPICLCFSPFRLPQSLPLSLPPFLSFSVSVSSFLLQVLVVSFCLSVSYCLCLCPLPCPTPLSLPPSLSLPTPHCFLSLSLHFCFCSPSSPHLCWLSQSLLCPLMPGLVWSRCCL